MSRMSEVNRKLVRGRIMPDMDKWRIDVNDRYQKVVDVVVGLSTASLILPILFLRSFLGVPESVPVLPKLNGWAFAAWVLLVLSITFGIAFYYASAKWVKLALGQPVWLSARVLERLLDIAFCLMVVCFLAGLICLVLFAIYVA
jgi:hypothetical protein